MSKNVKCEICGEEHKLQGFHWHLKKHGMTKQQYIDQYGEIKLVDAPGRAVEKVANDIEVIEVNKENVAKIDDELGEKLETTESIIKNGNITSEDIKNKRKEIENQKNRTIEENKVIRMINDRNERKDENMKEKSNMERIENDLVMLKQRLLLTALYVDEYGSLREMREVIAIARDENGNYTTMVLDNDGVLVPPANIENYYAIIKGEGKVLQKNIKLLMGKPIRVQPGPGKPTPARVSTKKGLFGRRSKKQGQPEGISDEDADAFYKEVTELSNE